MKQEEINKIKEGGKEENRNEETGQRRKKKSRERKDIICQQLCLSVLSVKAKLLVKRKRDKTCMKKDRQGKQ